MGPAACYADMIEGREIRSLEVELRQRMTRFSHRKISVSFHIASARLFKGVRELYRLISKSKRVIDCPRTQPACPEQLAIMNQLCARLDCSLYFPHVSKMPTLCNMDMGQHAWRGG